MVTHFNALNYVSFIYLWFAFNISDDNPSMLNKYVTHFHYLILLDAHIRIS